VDREPLAPRPGDSNAGGDTDRRGRSMTDSGGSPDVDCTEGDGRREGVGFSVAPFPFCFGASVVVGGMTGIVQ
jgi:hypothetical protein